MKPEIDLSYKMIYSFLTLGSLGILVTLAGHDCKKVRALTVFLMLALAPLIGPELMRIWK